MKAPDREIRGLLHVRASRDRTQRCSEGVHSRRLASDVPSAEPAGARRGRLGADPRLRRHGAAARRRRDRPPARLGRGSGIDLDVDPHRPHGCRARRRRGVPGRCRSGIPGRRPRGRPRDERGRGCARGRFRAHRCGSPETMAIRLVISSAVELGFVTALSVRALRGAPGRAASSARRSGSRSSSCSRADWADRSWNGSSRAASSRSTTISCGVAGPSCCSSSTCCRPSPTTSSRSSPGSPRSACAPSSWSRSPDGFPATSSSTGRATASRRRT